MSKEIYKGERRKTKKRPEERRHTQRKFLHLLLITANPFTTLCKISPQGAVIRAFSLPFLYLKMRKRRFLKFPERERETFQDAN